MSLEEYWIWLNEQWIEIHDNHFYDCPESIQTAVFVKSLPPYDKWLENRAIMGKGNVESEKAERHGIPHSPPNAEERVVNAIASAHESDTAQRLRELIREDIKKYYQGDKQDWPMGFRNGLNALCRQYGYSTVTSFLNDEIGQGSDRPEKALIALAKEQGMYVELWSD